MYPELIKLGNFSISSFGVMVALSFVVGYWLITKEAKRKGIDETQIGNLFLAAMVGGIVGAKLLYLFENVPIGEILRHPATHLLSRGGLTFYGGFIGAILLVWLLGRRYKLNFWKIGDTATPSLAMGYVIGRMGCFLVGDDYGIPSDLPWAVAFPRGLPPTTDTVHPTQIYEILIMFAVFVLIWKLRKMDKPTGWLFSLYLVLAGLERFVIEFVRNTTPSPIPNLSIAQLMAITIIAVGVIKLYTLRPEAKPSSEVKKA